MSMIASSTNARIDQPTAKAGKSVTYRGTTIALGDALELYKTWPAPVVIVSDGAYGISGFPGDPPTVQGMIDWYRPHIEAWSNAATGETTLWFWNTEIGWATIHPLLSQFGWQYVGCNVWDKGIAHISGKGFIRNLPRRASPLYYSRLNVENNPKRSSSRSSCLSAKPRRRMFSAA